MLEQYQQSSYYLQQVNPALKLFSLLIVVLFLLFMFDPWTPLLLWLFTLLGLRWGGGIPWRVISMLMLPFGLFAFSFLWLSILFPAERGESILFSLFTLPIAWENIQTGLSLGFRSLVFGSWSLLFVLTTDPTRLMLSLVQQCKLPPRYGYGLMAAYRFLPMLRHELNMIRAAHRIRGIGDSPGLRGRWQQLRRSAIPLLASAVRKAERVAIAMESKGFDGRRERTYYRTVSWSIRDLLFGVGLAVLLLALLGLRQFWV